MKAPGGKRPGAGRPKGRKNKASAEVREVIESLMPREERFELLSKMARKGNFRALELICFYADGKPTEKVDVNHSGAVKIIKDNIS